MKGTPLVIILAVLTVALAALVVPSCKKSSVGYQQVGQAAILIRHPWTMFSSDTTKFDSANNVTAHVTADLSSCQVLQHIILNSDNSWEYWSGCDKPAKLDNDGSWSASANYLVMNFSTCPRGCAPEYFLSAHIEFLNDDSLVLSEQISANDGISGVLSTVPETIRSLWTK